MKKLQKLLSVNCARIILDAVRMESGWLRFVSEESRINRKYFTPATFHTLRWFRLVRVLYFLSMRMNRSDFRQLGTRLFDEIWQSADEWEYDLVDEKE